MPEIVEESNVQERSSIPLAEHGVFVADEEEEQEEMQMQRREGRKRRIRIRKAKKMVMYPFKRINSLYSSNISNNQCSPPSTSASSSHSVVSSSSSSSKFSLGSSSKYPYYYGERPIGRCYLCFIEPPIEDDSPAVVREKKENNPNISSYEYVKSLIERNDFYSDDCNVHRN